MENPNELKYSKEHEWVRLEGDIATVGVTYFAQKQLTDIVFVELPEKGKNVEQGKQMAVIESVKSVSDVFSPVSGEVIEVNDKLKDNPELINNEPYGAGWIAKIKAVNKDELNNLMSADDYDKFVSETKH
ncbi:MAG: glycine cleavage system protein GcvH [Nanoarchaeota archaeon]|nr:glycine cleavage system protein GcvH [Nanoarchaeota archaeon]MBU1945777.1 glycine cleavage system protein GcvH [Nanoarchaeota archaeon]